MVVRDPRACRLALLALLAPGASQGAVLEIDPDTPPEAVADGRCSLIEAIVNANRDVQSYVDCNAGSGADVVLLPWRSEQDVPQDEGLPAITSSITLVGRRSLLWRSNPVYGAPLIRVNANGELTLKRITVSGASQDQDRYDIPDQVVIEVDHGRLIVEDSSIVDSYTGPGIDNRGGAVTLRRSVVSGHGARGEFYGRGGITNSSGAHLLLVNSTVADNGTPFRGAGISNAGSAVLINSNVSGNRITYEGLGGGILNGGSLTLIGTTVSNNSADIGGGIWNTSNGQAALVRSTLSGNRAYTTGGYGNGGGISSSGRLSLVNSTVSGNAAQYGGGIFSDGRLVVASSTITGNHARVQGGGLLGGSGTTVLKRSIVSGNSVDSHPGLLYPGREVLTYSRYLDRVGGTITVGNYNVFGYADDAGTNLLRPGPTDIVPRVGLEEILRPLANNGGPTRTHALTMESPALNATPDDEDCPATDQRQNRRPRQRACDAGAFEGHAVWCYGEVTTMVGTPEADFLKGTPGPDVISGLGGQDQITGLEGDDVICAGHGWDHVWGGPGDDLISGGNGNDVLKGNRGDDRLYGGSGDDSCDGGVDGLQGDVDRACESTSGVP